MYVCMHVLKAYAYLDVDRHHYVEIDGWMDDGRWTKGWRDGWMDGWMDAWMAQSMQILPTHQDLRHEPAFFTKLYDGSNGLLQPSAVCFKRRAWISCCRLRVQKIGRFRVQGGTSERPRSKRAYV